jgi:hypothetical protein
MPDYVDFSKSWNSEFNWTSTIYFDARQSTSILESVSLR